MEPNTTEDAMNEDSWLEMAYEDRYPGDDYPDDPDWTWRDLIEDEEDDQ